MTRRSARTASSASRRCIGSGGVLDLLDELFEGWPGRGTMLGQIDGRLTETGEIGFPEIVPCVGRQDLEG